MRQRSPFNGLRLTDKFEEFLRTHPETPFLAMDGDVVLSNASTCAHAFARTIYYAVKANPVPDLVALLAAVGAGFDISSRGCDTRAAGGVSLRESQRGRAPGIFRRRAHRGADGAARSLQPARLGVVARTSTVRYKRTTASAAQIGRELGVDYLLEGSVRRAGERVRVIAQLVDASQQTRLWSKTYERPVVDVLHIRREIADHLIRSLSIQLLPARASRAAAAPVNFESYDKYLLGLHGIGKGTREGGKKAIERLKDALARNPENAPIRCGARADLHRGQHLL